MGTLFQIPKKEKPAAKTGSKINVKGGQSVNSLIVQARKLVEEKLGKYKDTSKCCIDPDKLQAFFDSTPQDTEIAIDTETTG